ncbi:MAG: ribose-phosphate pyrophosphokinase [Arenicellales bacterium WSBS_2016_MAG_OTU3]
MLFSGNANPELAKQIAKHLGLPLGKAVVNTFSDGEINVEIMENVRGRDVFIIQPTCAPTNNNLMELLVMIDALKRSAAQRINAVIPYFGYARQDRRPRTARVAISAKLVATMIGASGADRVVTMDLHADQIQGFFSIPTDNIYASPVLLGELWRKQPENLLIVSPDVGGVVRARAMAKHLEADLAIIDKRRPKANEAKVMNIIGEVQGRMCVMVDDMVDTANTLCQAAAALKDAGADGVMACCTHPVLSGPAVERIAASELDEMLVTNTIPLSKEAQQCEKVRQISIADLLAESIRRIAEGDSVSSLFVD